MEKSSKIFESLRPLLGLVLTFLRNDVSRRRPLQWGDLMEVQRIFFSFSKTINNNHSNKEQGIPLPLPPSLPKKLKNKAKTIYMYIYTYLDWYHFLIYILTSIWTVGKDNARRFCCSRFVGSEKQFIRALFKCPISDTGSFAPLPERYGVTMSINSIANEDWAIIVISYSYSQLVIRVRLTCLSPLEQNWVVFHPLFFCNFF